MILLIEDVVCLCRLLKKNSRYVCIPAFIKRNTSKRSEYDSLYNPIPKKMGYTYRLTGIGLGVSVHGTPCVLKPDKQQKMMVDGFKFTFLFYLQLQLKKASYSIVQYRYSIHYED